MKNENYITIQWWMINELKLKWNELVLYAIIYWFSQDWETKYRWSLSYIQNSLKISRHTVISLLKKLEEKWLIIKKENKTWNLYSINQQVVQKLHQGSAEIALVGSAKTSLVGSAEIAPNNNIYIYNNKYNNIYNKFKKYNHNKIKSSLISMKNKITETTEQLNQDVNSGSWQLDNSSPPTPSPLKETGAEIRNRWQGFLWIKMHKIDARKLDLIYNYCKENKLQVNKSIMKTFLKIIITITYDDIKFYLNKKYDNTNHLINTLNKFNKAS